MGRSVEDRLLVEEAGVKLPEGAKITPMLRQWLAAKARAKEAILLFRMGDFYELFAEDAVRAGPVLDLVVTSRDKGKDKASAIAMAGFPHHAAPGYIARLIAAGEKVAVCDQLEDPSEAKGIVRRGVTRVVTPGMVLDDEGLCPESNNWLCALWAEGARYGIAAVDVSTGRFIATTTGSLASATAELARLSPAEVLLPVPKALGEAQAEQLLSGIVPPPRTERVGAPASKSAPASWDAHFGAKSERAAKRACLMCVAYIEDAQGTLPAHLTPPRPYTIDGRLLIDPVTRRHLDLIGPRGERRRPGTLAHVLCQTVTAPGARRMLRLIEAPSADFDAVQARLAQTAALVENTALRDELRDALRGVHDTERLCGRIVSGRASPGDMGRLRATLQRALGVRDVLAAHPDTVAGDEGAARIEAVADLAAHLEAALADDVPAQLGDAPVFALGYDNELDEARALKEGGQDAIFALEQNERDATGIANLKVKYTRVFGYYIEVTKTHLKKVPDHYRRKQTVANAERFLTEELSSLEEKLALSEQRHKAREAMLFADLVGEVAHRAPALLALTAALAELDARAAAAMVSSQTGYVRPEILDMSQRRLVLKSARHPVVEEALRPLGERYVPADIELSGHDRQLLIVTGPNMGGKSTLMRKVALIQVMAQAGFFVPAQSAELSVCDRIFTRVGAADNIAQGQSTFMVEMTETAHILQHATKNSLILLDEIGRGTATFDGLSIAWAVGEFIHDEVQARTLFATHYHELCDLAAEKPRVHNIHVVVKEWNDEIIFARTVKEGGAARSYGIQVARLAGLPAAVLARARELLAELEGDVMRPDSADASGPRVKNFRKKPDDQLGLFAPAPARETDPAVVLVDEISQIDVNRLSPLQALNRLDALVREAKRAGVEKKPRA